jgi:hypothetical protein
VHPYYSGKPITADEWKILKLYEYWQYFITLTFKDLGTRSGRINRVNHWLRYVAHQGETTKRYLTYVIRWECGEIGGRPHCHLFVGGMKLGNRITVGHMLENEWFKRHASRAQARLFDRSKLRKVANYVGGEDVDWGKNRYEIGKFRTADIVYFSQHAEEVLRQIQDVAAA